MGCTSVLVCLGLLAVGSGDAGAHVAWVADAPLEAPREGRRVARDVGPVSSGAHMIELVIESEITYRYARTTMNCVLVNNNAVANQIAFRTTLPIAAFISSFHIDVGGRRHVGRVKTKAEARRIYNEATASGKTAAEVELNARDANLFTVNVNVEAHESVAFTLIYEELLVRRLGLYTHAVHIDPGQIVDDLKVKITIEESNSIQHLTVDPIRPFDSTTQSGNHDEDAEDPLPTVTRPTPETTTIEWSPTPEEQRNLRKDGIEGRFVVQYDIDRLSNPNQILVHDGYFVHFFAPSDITPMDKHVVFVLDTSGSMSGSRILQLKEAMGKILSDLRPGDFFSIVEFNSHIKAWQGSGVGSVQLNLNSVFGGELVVKATLDKIQEAKNYVQSLALTGATNIHDSLTIALKIIDVGANKFASLSKRPEPMIMFLTDGDPNEGAVSDKALIPSAIETTNNKQTPMFCLGFGKGIDMNFLKELSLKNNGFARLIYEGSDAAMQLEDFYREVSSPLLKDLKFRYTNVVTSTLTQVGFDTFHSGTEMIMSGKIRGNLKNVRGAIRAKSRNGNYNTGFPVPEQVTIAREDFMERLWAYLNIQQLLVDPKNVDNNLKAQEMALKYSFVTPLTSLVVVRPDSDDYSATIDPLLDERIVEELPSIEVGLEPEGTSDYNLPVEPLTFVADTRSKLPAALDTNPLRLAWAGPQFNGTHVIITKRRKTKAYAVKANPTNKQFAACRNASGKWHHCKHVKSCILPAFVDNVQKYETSYFCAIPGDFAGVCCPNN